MKKEHINRREFLKKTAACAIGAAGTAVLPSLAFEASGQSSFPDVVVAEGAERQATRKAIDLLGGMSRFVKPENRVVIKPNMSFPNPPEMGSTTHPDVIAEIISMCIESGASSVKVIDNPLRNDELCVERTGMGNLADLYPKCSVHAIADKRFFKELSIEKGVDLKKTMIMKEVLKSDVLITAPVAKSHSATGVSLSLKGMMGLIHNRSEMHLNMDLNTAIVDLCTLLSPDLVVIDASRILTNGGPGGPGEVIKFNKIIASRDMVAADAMAVELGTWYGKKFKAAQVKHILIAHERGIGRIDLEKLNIKEVTV
jgi:uncharacterized protein (DUF362 family)